MKETGSMSSDSKTSSYSSADPEKGNESNEPPPPKKQPCFLYRPLVKFFTSEPDKYRTWKMFLGFPFGAVLGYGLYRMIVLPMALTEETRNVLGAMLVFGISAGYSLSVYFRCVCILLIPTFMGKAGRSYLGAYAVVFLIAGPIENIVDNAQDITRSLTCAAQLSANHTKAKWKFRLQPVGNVMKDMAEEGWMLNKLGKKVNEAFIPIKAEINGDKNVAEMEARTIEEDQIEGGKIDRAGKIEAETKGGPNDDQSKKVENKYKKKVKFECEDIYNKAIKECRKVFSRLEDRCKNVIPSPLDKFLCKLVNVGWLCRIVEPLGKALGGECKPSDVIRPSFGKMYKKSEESVENMDEGFKVKMQYKVVKGKDDVDYTSVEEMRSNTMHSFKQGRKWVNFLMTLLKRLLGFTFLLVIISAYKYNKKFTHDIRFDNIYITSYFRKIDARRKFKRKRVLLPLKKIEADHVIFPTSAKLMKSERKKLGKGSLLIIARAVLAGLVFLVGDILYTVLNIIRTHSRVDYRQTESYCPVMTVLVRTYCLIKIKYMGRQTSTPPTIEHPSSFQGNNTIDVKIGGTGFMSNIVRMFMTGLNTKNKLDQVSSNVECLPRPVPLDKIYYGYVFGVYLLIWTLVLLDAYGLRLRKVIAAFFYRKARSGLMYSLGRQCPGLCGCLTRTSAGRDKCLICEEKLKKDFKKCDNEDCKFVYCRECWRDIKKTCYACMPLEDFSATDSDSMTDDNKDDDEI
ncbi:E3 ubiquitin-protein ligase DCST1-like isoform X2 [Mercenaria mercenaria]|uniref:E3 ubiquitin-protein ligase DCST1-like isoform X2 n=1 Tax=Mercenaria mercenaria TaxID=6596 RepID=UPI00234F90E2|nr:E3 ubiquitin-protein ligase DCST1-like isoform X2 [Mercenaria mercenaria]